MKYISKKDLIRRNIWRLYRERKYINRLNHKLRRNSEIREYIYTQKKYLPNNLKIRPGLIPFNIPAALSLKDGYVAVINLVNSIRENVLEKKRRIALYFDGLKSIDLGAALILTSEIYRCKHGHRNIDRKYVTGTYPRNRSVYELLHRVGFFDLLQVISSPPRNSTNKDKSVYFTQFRTGHDVKPDNITRFLYELQSMGANLTEKQYRYLYAALVEITKNSVEHAYKIKISKYQLKRQWWLTGLLDKAEKTLDIFIYDQGSGIPATFRPHLNKFFEFVLSKLNPAMADAELIRWASQPGRTSTLQPGRGQGFATMKKAVNNLHNGSLTVVSAKGGYSYTTANEKSFPHDVALDGTLTHIRATIGTVKIEPKK